MNDPVALYAIAGVLAFIPALIWLSVLFRRTGRRKIQILIFAGSIFAVVPVFLLQFFLNLFPQFDVLHFLQSNITDQNLNLLLLFISVGIVEEIVKQSLVRLVDKRYLLIQTINESIQYSLIAALGFSFAENIFYIFSIYSQLGIQQLFVAYLFRSVFTTCAHMLFSGFFGYFYGIAKFSLNIVEQSQVMGQKKKITQWLANKMEVSTFEAYKEITILKGAAIAISMHAFFNFLLQLNQIIPVVIFVLCGYLILRRLIRQKTGRMIMMGDLTHEGHSTMAQKDEDIVIELLGMWFNQKRYVDVIHICQRLLERDPDNKVIQLFKTKSVDKLNSNDAYSKILQNLFPKNKVESIAAIAKEQGLRGKTVAEPAAEKSAAPAETEEKNDEQTFNLKI